VNGKRALVIGASGDIGRAVVDRLLSDGSRVVALAFRVPSEHLSWHTKVDRIIRADLMDIDAASLLRELPWDELDLLVNCQGGAKPHPFAEVTDSEWETCLALNLTAVFRLMRAAQPMLAKTCGAVVNLTSVAAHTGGAFGPHYAAAKAGLIGLTRSAAREWGPLGIRVNAVAPGPVDSRMTDQLSDEQMAGLLAATALRRAVTPAEVADAVAWLASAPAVTGQTIIVDGGRVFV
jgi:3-oxoacyl-[acyl-carrier protein] reductase